MNTADCFQKVIVFFNLTDFFVWSDWMTKNSTAVWNAEQRRSDGAMIVTMTGGF